MEMLGICFRCCCRSYDEKVLVIVQRHLLMALKWVRQSMCRYRPNSSVNLVKSHGF